MKTIDSLGLFWTFNTATEKYQEEVDGLVFFGYWADMSDGYEPLLNKKDFITIRGNDSINIKTRTWQGDNNCHYSIEMLIEVWPNEISWEQKIEDSLKWFIVSTR